MRKRIAVAVALGAIIALTSAHAQTTLPVWLVASGTPRQVQAAIDNGADVNARDVLNMTPLMYAAELNPNPKVITTLIAAGADIKARDDHGATPLMVAAASTPNSEVITTLLAAGANAKAKSNAGKTAFGKARDNESLKDTDALKKLEEASK